MKHKRMLVLVGTTGTNVKYGKDQKWVSFSVASEESKRKSDGTFDTKTHWFNCLADSFTAKKMHGMEEAKKKVKGCEVMIIGDIKQSQKTGHEGKFYVQVEDIRFFN